MNSFRLELPQELFATLSIASTIGAKGCLRNYEYLLPVLEKSAEKLFVREPDMITLLKLQYEHK
jgi:hypothetical protein